MEEWNVWYDLQSKCQCCSVMSVEGERDRGAKLNFNVFVNHGEAAVSVCQRKTEEGEKEDGGETRAAERQAACVFVRYRD